MVLLIGLDSIVTVRIEFSSLMLLIDRLDL